MNKYIQNEHQKAQAYGRALHNSCCVLQDEAAHKACPSAATKEALEASKLAAKGTYDDLDPAQRVRLVTDLKRVTRKEVTIKEVNDEARRDVFAAAQALNGRDGVSR